MKKEVYPAKSERRRAAPEFPLDPRDAMLDPWIIEEIKKREEKQKEEQPQIPLDDTPEHDPEEKRKWEEEEKRKKIENPGGVEKIDLA